MRSTYKIKRGDTLGAIARRLGTTVKKLAELNGIKDPNKIRAGASLKLPVAAKQKWMEIQNKESGAKLSKKTSSTGAGNATSRAITERQKAYKTLSDSQKATGGSGAVLSNKAKKPASVSKPTPKPKLYATIDPNTGRNAKRKVTASQHIANIEKAIANGVLSGKAQFERQTRALAQANVDKLLKKAVKAKKMNKGGAALKSVPAGNPGLKKLPTAVRNRMGFMRKGGVAKKK